jgi:hypothetical protein
MIRSVAVFIVALSCVVIVIIIMIAIDKTIISELQQKLVQRLYFPSIITW